MTVDVARGALEALQSLHPTEAAKYWAPGFTLRSNGATYDRAASMEMFTQRQARLNESPHVEFVDIFPSGDCVGVWRVASLATKHGTLAPAVVLIDVWRVKEGQIVSGDQCWQVLRVFPGDDLALSSSEAATAAAVHDALEALGDLDRMQATLGEHWDPAFQGYIDGTTLDLTAMRQHCAALQACLAQLEVEVKELIVHSGSVGAVYHLKAEKKGGGRAEVRVLAVFTVTKGGKITSCKSVSRLIEGDAGDVRLASMMPSDSAAQLAG